MKRYTNPLLFTSFAVVLLAQSALGQTKAKPSPSYEGQSLPPASDAIVASPETPEPTLSTRPATEPAPAAAPAPAPVPAAQPMAAVAAPSNPDAGIVGDTPATVASTTAGSNLEPTLYERSVNPDADIVQVQPKHSGALDTGTLIRVRIQEALSTSKTAPGDPFSAIVMSPVEQSGKVIIPMGSEVKGRVVSVRVGKAMRGKATMRLRPDVVTMPDGSRYMLHAQVVPREKGCHTVRCGRRWWGNCRRHAGWTHRRTGRCGNWCRLRDRSPAGPESPGAATQGFGPHLRAYRANDFFSSTELDTKQFIDRHRGHVKCPHFLLTRNRTHSLQRLNALCTWVPHPLHQRRGNQHEHPACNDRVNAVVVQEVVHDPAKEK
jgi:hypothetical protein